MYILYVENTQSLGECSRLFDEWMEPLLVKLDAFSDAGRVPPSLPEIQEYLQVCRWPFRRLEYSFALDILLDRLKPGDAFLDAGSGVTPFAHIFSGRGIESHACDAAARVIRELNRLKPEIIYQSTVSLTTQDLTATTYPDAMFDAVSCISVLEHIPAPVDQCAVNELLRILKPGGILVLTVDFTPTSGYQPLNRIGYYWSRAVGLARKGNLREIVVGVGRKLEAQQAVRTGAARKPRSANQCFEADHLVHDILPLLRGEQLSTRLPFSTDLDTVTLSDARRFWDMEGIGNIRAVLPIGIILKKRAF